MRLSQTHSPAGWLLPVLILGVPLFDTTLIIISRSRRGLLPFASPGKDHTAHRISNLGLGQKRAVLALYGLGCTLGTLGLLSIYLSASQVYVLLGMLLILSLIAIYALEKFPYEHQCKPSSSLYLS